MSPTYTMSARVLAVALCTKLVALITGSTDSPPDGTCDTWSSRSWAIGMLSMFWLRAASGEVRVWYADMLLELLKGVVRPLAEYIESIGLHVWLRDMSVGHEGG